MARTYAETPHSISGFNGSEIIVVQDGTAAAPDGYGQMKKTTLANVRDWITGGIAGALTYRGSCTWEQLQAKTGMKAGDMWNVTDRGGQNYAWTGSEWDALGETKETYTKAETDEIVGAISSECEERAKGIDDRLNYHDFRKVDRNATFILDGDGEQNLKQMMDSTGAYEQDAIMLSLEPIIPTASSHNFGIRGQIACDDTYLYVCTSENQWKKIPLQNL